MRSKEEMEEAVKLAITASLEIVSLAAQKMAIHARAGEFDECYVYLAYLSARVDELHGLTFKRIDMHRVLDLAMNIENVITAKADWATAHPEEEAYLNKISEEAEAMATGITTVLIGFDVEPTTEKQEETKD